MMLRCVFLAFSTFLVLAVALKTQYSSSAQCGYAACPKVEPGMLNIHLVPHTHDDVGWLKTVDQYYYGSNTDKQNAGVQYILDSVVQQLLHDKSKRFIWVETAFLWQWWKEQNDHLRHQVKKLVSNGQLEIIGGGWSMNDEAVTHYQSTIDQFTWGFRKLNDTFGFCGRPHIGWQIDPFGHSRETASIMAQMGFDGLFFGRLDYQDKAQRLSTKTPEFVWQASDNLGETSWLFTHVLFNHYSPPPGFCFDILCDDEPFIDSKNSPDYNVDKKVDLFLEFAKKQASVYRSQNIIMTMGQDFNYQDANSWFKNLDKLIRYVNQRQSNDSKINVFYSTPSCYLKSVHDSNMTWTTKQDDFFPYPSDQNSYWTGYFTSRPTLKFYERQGNNFLQVCKQLYALADLGPEDKADLNAMREAMGMMQHHDAITGTEQQHVAEDYALRLDRAFDECHNTAEIAINQLMQKDSSSPPIDMEPCHLLNISQCYTTENNDMFVVTAYNPLARPVTHFVRLPVVQAHYKVFDNKGTELVVQLVPIPAPVLKIPGRISQATQELVFKAVDLPPLGFRTYFIKKEAGSVFPAHTITGPGKLTLENERLRLRFNRNTGLLQGVRIDGQETVVDQSFMYYEAAVGDNMEPKNRSSGAYIFRPRSSDPVSLGKAKTTTVKGPLVQELHQEFSDWVSQVIRIYDGQPTLELQWLVGPIPIEDNIGKEVITRFSTSWPTDGTFYTDSNGRELLKRKRNWRPTWRVNISEPVSGNYYPVTTVIAIKKGDNTLAILPDRAQGGSSLKDGDIELMVHRRLLHDDAFGVGEALNETAFGKGLVARGRHIVALGVNASSPSVMAQQRHLSQGELVLPPWLLMASSKLTWQEWSKLYTTEYSGLSVALPPNVHLLTLEPWKGTSLLLRLEHFFESNEDPKLSKAATVQMEGLFSAFTLVSARETTLGGNQWLEDSARLAWSIDSNEIPGEEKEEIVKMLKEPPNPSNKFTITLQPMQIRTFIIQVKPCKTIH